MYKPKSISYSQGLENYDTQGRCRQIKKPNITSYNGCDNPQKTYLSKNAQSKSGKNAYKKVGDL